jgi:hypothetical protein
LVRDDVTRVVNRLVADDLTVYQQGKPTSFGDLNADVLGLPVNGFNAVLALAVLKTAAHITGDPAHLWAYRHYAETKSYGQAVANFLFLNFGPLRNYSNYNMAMLALYILTGLEQDPTLAAMYQVGLSKIYGDVRHESNSFFNFIYAARRAGGASPQVVVEGLDSLDKFPYPYINRFVQNSLDPSIAVSLFANKKGNPQAVDPIPFEKRVPSNFIWRSNPHKLDGGADNGEIFPVTAYVSAYWLGRFHQLF